MSRSRYNWASAHRRIGRGGIFHVRYWSSDGIETCSVHHILDVTYSPHERSYLVCRDRWIPLESVLAIRPYRE